MKFLLKIFSPKKSIIVHDGAFHADEICACAILSIVENDHIKIIRTRNEDKIQKGDYVLDVGGTYDHGIRRYDHHQNGGAGKRENGLEYATAGLVWKHYGKLLVKNDELFNRIDEQLIQPIDMIDNGQGSFFCDYKNVYPYSLNSIVQTRKPTWREEDLIDMDREFKNLVSFFKDIIIREIEINRDELLARKQVEKAAEESSNENYIILNKAYPFDEALQKYPHVLYVVCPRKDGSWRVQCVRKSLDSFENRKSFPASWGGIRTDQLRKITGVPEARFCHRALFLCVADTKEGAIALAEEALRGNE